MKEESHQRCEMKGREMEKRLAKSWQFALGRDIESLKLEVSGSWRCSNIVGVLRRKSCQILKLAFQEPCSWPHRHWFLVSKRRAQFHGAWVELVGLESGRSQKSCRTRYAWQRSWVDTLILHTSCSSCTEYLTGACNPLEAFRSRGFEDYYCHNRSPFNLLEDFDCWASGGVLSLVRLSKPLVGIRGSRKDNWRRLEICVWRRMVGGRRVLFS